MTPPGKKALVVIAMSGKGKPMGEKPEGGKDTYARAEQEAFGEFASAMGIEPKNPMAATAALRNFVKACIARSKAGEYDEGGGNKGEDGGNKGDEGGNPGPKRKGSMGY
jgi:hypothetical protein